MLRERSAAMAIGSLPANPVVWQPDSPHTDRIASLRQASASEDKRAKPPFDEPAPEFRDSSVSRVSICSLGGAELNSLPVSPCFQQAWSEGVSLSVLQYWHPCEVPLPPAFWHSAHHSAPRDHVADSPLFEKWEQQALGRSPLLLSLFATLPRASATCRHVADQLHALHLWGTWMEEFGTREEYRTMASFFRSLELTNGAHSRQLQIDSPFPRRLSKKYPGLAETFVKSMRLLFPQQPSGSKAPWSTEYLTLWALYAEEGLTLHRKIRTMCEAKQTADPSEFLVCRALTSCFPHLALLAAKNSTTDPPEAEALNAVYPLLALGSMLGSTFSDLFLASRQLADKSGSVSSLQMFDDEWATVVHNSLLVLFHEEADTLLAQASPRPFRAGTAPSLTQASAAVRSQVVRLVGTIKAALHGLVVWHQTVPAFRNRPELAAADLAFSFASSVGNESPHAPASASALAPDSKPPAAHEESNPLPPWVTDAVDSAIGRLVQLLRSSAPLSNSSPH